MSENNGFGILYLCATPIGNLGDISNRAIEILSMVDLIAAEDTRNSKKLLSHYDIHTPLSAYHEFNKIKKADEILNLLMDGKNIALISDAGTPAISDPGAELINMCYERGINVTSLPGPCALINALILSGISPKRFVFDGFLPTAKENKKLRVGMINALINETRTIILYEAPHKLKRSLSDLYDVLGNRRISLCREMTKKFEDIHRCDLEGAIKYYEDNEPRGEYVIVIEGRSEDEIRDEKIKKWDNVSINEHLKVYLDMGYDKKEAMKKMASDLNISKSEVYKKIEKSKKAADGE